MPTAGSTTARGYGPAHRRERAKYQPLIDSGQGWCTETRCLHRTRWIPPGTPWDLAHTPDRTAYLGPAHPHCNRSDGQKRGQQAKRTRGKFRQSRHWL